MFNTTTVRLLLFLIFLLPLATQGQPAPDDATRPVLPDGSPFPLWANETTYTRTYVVNRNHPAAGDDNRTISAAARRAVPGERILIHSGVYREKVVPARGGTGPDAMISYEAAPGARVVIKGSEVLPGEWQRTVVDLADGGRSTISQRLWMIDLPGTLFPEASPFKIPNADSADIEIMPWAHGWRGHIPYTLPRGLVFQNGRRLVQLATLEDLIRVPGSYWVAPGGERLHVHAYDSSDPNEQTMEVTVRQQLFVPDETDIGYIRVRGLTFAHAGNGFPRTGVGALFTRGGHHWIIENNRFHGINSVAVEIGARSIETADRERARRDRARAEASPGQVIVRGNVISDAGTGGVQGLLNHTALVEANHFFDIGWQDVERYWENAAVKWLIANNTLVRNNLVHDVQAGSAIWLDWDNRNSRITRNTVYDVTMCCNGALFVEASQHPNMIDHNILWDIDGIPIYTGDTDSLVIAHNFIGRSTGPSIVSRVGTDRTLNGRPLTSKHNQILYNVLYETRSPFVQDPENVVDHNVYASEAVANESRAAGFDEQSTIVALDADFDPEETMLRMNVPQLLPQRPALPRLHRDFFGMPRAQEATVGPFQRRFTGGVEMMIDPISMLAR